jgi:hypothetical protein
VLLLVSLVLVLLLCLSDPSHRDLKGVIDAGMNQYPYKYYTYQHYPQNNCNGLNAKNTNLTYYATHANLDSYFSWQTGVAAAQAAGVASMVSEFNTVSCGVSSKLRVERAMS